MRQIPHTFTLLPQQTRMINATEGFRLEVCSGCLWLTRPGDSVDRFLVAGSAIDLHENNVLIQSDVRPRDSHWTPAHYVLVPLAKPDQCRPTSVACDARVLSHARNMAARLFGRRSTGWGINMVNSQ